MNLNPFYVDWLFVIKFNVRFKILCNSQISQHTWSINTQYRTRNIFWGCRSHEGWEVWAETDECLGTSPFLSKLSILSVICIPRKCLSAVLYLLHTLIPQKMVVFALKVCWIELLHLWAKPCLLVCCYDMYDVAVVTWQKRRHWHSSLRTFAWRHQAKGTSRTVPIQGTR